MTPIQRFMAWSAGTVLAVIVFGALVGTIRGTLPPAILISALAPTFGGLVTGLVFKAKSDTEKDGKK